MKIYNAKTLFKGVVVGKKDTLYVGVPGGQNYTSKHDYSSEKNFKVLYDGKEMIIKNWHKAEAFRKFDDKQGRGNYTLGYFEWKPIKETTDETVSITGALSQMVGTSTWEKLREKLHNKS